MDKKKISIPLFILLLAAAGCASSKEADVPFKYGTIIQKAFGELGDGREIPVTIEKATEIDGSSTADGQFLFFSSDRNRGNFDIYLRSMTDITTVRVTSHPSKDSSPAVSPDGKYLAFVSTRDDPQGDVYVMRVKPKDMVEDFASNPEKSYDDDASNISAQIDAVSRAPLSVKDADPAWSPDGGSIVFSSSRNGDTENLFICGRKGKNIRQLTTKGGMHPRFSQDGSLVVFVSYRDNPQGEIYTVDAANGKESRLTSMAGIKLYPSFSSSNEDVLFTLIDRDTNSDGKLDFKDMSVLYRYSSEKKTGYPLTLYSTSSFRGRWFPAYAQKYLNSQDDNFKGVVLYSSQEGDNININIIPEYGIIPKRKNAADQLSLAENYLRDEGESAKYRMALLRVYYYFGERNDADSQISVSRALYRAANEYLKAKEVQNSRDVRILLSSLSKKSDSFAGITGAAFDLLSAGKSPYEAYASVLKGDGKSRTDFAYLLDDAAQACAAKGDGKKAIELYLRILKDFPTYKKISAVNYALAQLVPAEPGTISQYYLEVVKKADPYLRDKAAGDIVRIFRKEKNAGLRISFARKIYPASDPSQPKLSKEDAAVSAILDYVIGAAYAEQEDYAAAAEHLTKALSKLRSSEVLYYDANVLLSTIASKKGEGEAEEKFLYSAVTNYLNRWNKAGFTDTVLRLISYYENAGADLEYSGDYKKASDLYQRYVKVVTYLHWLKKFEPLYNEYGARAHVLYVDAAAALSEDTSANLDALAAQYTGDKLDIARLNFDKAHIYGLSWIYARKGIEYDRRIRGFALDVTEGMIAESFSRSGAQIDWALFMDDQFCDPYILQGWINQYIDLRREELAAKNDFIAASKYEGVFPRLLWERNKSVYQKGLDVNDEVKFPDKEGSLHLNLANTQFLLGNFTAAHDEYVLAAKYKKNFGSKKEESLFRYHFGYCLWQNGDLAGAKREMRRVLDIYNSAGSSQREAAQQRSILYRYLALFERSDRNYEKALEWYDKLVDESSRFRIKTDLARTYIDMAWCCEQSGDDLRALSLLARSETMLKKADDNDPAYKLQFRLFGVLPFQLFDLGLDSVVIGDSKIPGRLSTAQQRLLVESAYERILLRRGEIVNARVHIARRLDILKGRKSSIDVEMKIRALNSDGYCLFNLGKYAEAKARFEEALAFSSDPDINNTGGMSASIGNLVELYAFSCENGISLLSSPVSDIDALKARLLKFRSDYETLRYENERKAIEAAAESKKLEVKQADLDAAKQRVALEAAEKYPEMDLAAATLDFYSAEFRSAQSPPSDIVLAYKAQRDIFRTYADAAVVFEEGSSAPKAPLTKKAKLLLNAAVCREKTGMSDKAYELLGRAEQTAAASLRDDVLWTVYCREALFLRDSGASVDEGYLRSSAKYFENACSIIERAPALYAGQAEMIQSLYRDYAVLALRRSDFAAAFRISERGYAVERIISIAREAPSFEGTPFEADYSAYQEHLARTRIAVKARGDFAASDLKDDAQSAKLEKEAASAFAGLNSFGKELGARSPLFASCLFVRADAFSGNELGSSVVYRFIRDGSRAYGWRVTSRGQSVHQLNAEGKGFSSSIASFMNEDKDAARFVVLNDTAEEVFSRSREGLPPFTFVPSAERARFFVGAQSAAAGAFVSAATADAKVLLSSDILGGTAAEISPVLFSGKASPSLCAVSASSSVQMRAVMEGMIISGCRSALFFSGASPVQKKEDISAFGAGVADANRLQISCFASGAAATFVRSGDASVKKEFRDKSEAALSRGDAKSAMAFFGKYHSVSQSLSADDLLLLARIDELNGDYAEGAKHAAEAASAGSGEYLSWAVYLQLKDGNVPAAKELLSKAAGQAFADSADAAFYRAIISLVLEGTPMPPLPDGKSFVPRGRLSLLQFRYAKILGAPTGAADIASVSSPDDYCVSSLSGAAAQKGDDARSAKVLSFISGKDRSGDEALYLSAPSGRQDRLSVYPLLALLFDDTHDDAAFIRSLRLDVCTQAGRLDRIIFLSAAADAFRRADLAEEEKSALVMLDGELTSSGMAVPRAAAALRRAENLALCGAYKESAALLAPLDQTMLNAAKLSARWTLLSAECEIFLKKHKEGTERLEGFVPATDAESVMKETLLAHSERLRIADSAAYAAEGLPRYEERMKRATALLDPSLFGAKGIREDLVCSGLDFLVSFCMRKGDTRSAILYGEIRRQVSLWSSTGSAYRVSLSAAASEAYASAKTAQSYAHALSAYPELAYEKRILFSPLEALQKKVPYGSSVLVISKNEDDIFAWIIERESVQPVRIADGYKKIAPAVAGFESAVRDMTPVSAVASSLNQLLAPVIKPVSGKRVFIVADEFTEKIPFEILGSGKMLGREGKLFYLGSLAGSLEGFTEPAAVCAVIGGSALDGSAVRESGIASGNKPNGIAHIASGITAGRSELQTQNTAVKELVRDKALAWIGGSVPYESESVFSSQMMRSSGVSVLLNGAERGVNGQYFASLLYERLARGDSIEESYSAAIGRLSESQQWAHPAHWAGIRLYLRGVAEK